MRPRMHPKSSPPPVPAERQMAAPVRIAGGVPEAPYHPKYDQIHRALLSGLLSNIGQKTDAYEYTGARATKFNLHPASALFEKKPRWVMSAELVQTTRLFARTNAGIDPLWAEGLAGHLVQRSYSEPHWNRETAHVEAYERVALYGLVLVPKRVVHFGPIDAKQAREIFIGAALVDGQFRTQAPFFKHNAEVLKQAQSQEHKARRHDLVVDRGVRVAFYEARIPMGIHNGPLFERWRRDAERKDPGLLFMRVEDLLRPGAVAVLPEDFPDATAINDNTLPLVYRYVPGEADDGLTLRLPLALLNQVRPERFDFLVPGLLKEKVTALIKSLPSAIRKSFVPVPAYADAVMQALVPGEDPLTETLAATLGKLTGVVIPREAWKLDTLPAHLLMHYEVLDERNTVIAKGREIAAIRRQLGARAATHFVQIPQPEFNRDQITEWDFGDLPEKIELRQREMTLQGYPALVDQTGSVSLRLLDSPAAAGKAMRAGLRRLFMLHYAREFKHIASHLPHITRMSLHHTTLGPAQGLKDDLLTAIADRAFLHDGPVIRNRTAFETAARAGIENVLKITDDVCDLADALLTNYHAVTLELDNDLPAEWTPSIFDVNEQITHLLPRKFLTHTPAEWLVHFPRYIKALQIRLSRLRTQGPERDVALMEKVRPFWRSYLQRLAQHEQAGIQEPALADFRWLIEELRVQLFAQELPTAVVVSPRRLEKFWLQVRA